MSGARSEGCAATTEARIGIHVKRIFAQCRQLVIHVRRLGSPIFCVNLENFARLDLIYEGWFFERAELLGPWLYCGRLGACTGLGALQG
jgi:hypothetical protein